MAVIEIKCRMCMIRSTNRNSNSLQDGSFDVIVRSNASWLKEGRREVLKSSAGFGRICGRANTENRD